MSMGDAISNHSCDRCKDSKNKAFVIPSSITTGIKLMPWPYESTISTGYYGRTEDDMVKGLKRFSGSIYANGKLTVLD